MHRKNLWFRLTVYVMAFLMLITFNYSAYASLSDVEQSNPPTSKQTEVVKIIPVEIDSALTNPLMGWAVDGRDVKGSYKKQPVSMAYVGITWNELQPVSENAYDWNAFESKYNLQYCRDNNIKIVLRLTLDKPREYEHKDIPEWLYKKIGGEKGGVSYSLKNDTYKGFCPDYTNSVLIDEHEKLLRAMGDRYANDPVLGYIQLGSIGHYGEWWIRPEIRETLSYPDNNLISRYVSQYRQAFPNIHLLTRRPFEAISGDNMGFYNDMFGDVQDTYRWLSWIDGKVTKESSESYTYKKATDFWKYAPSGGEFASGDPSLYINSASIDASVKLVEDSHTSWLGPCSAATLNGKYQPYIDSMMKKMGYRYVISSVTLPKSVKVGQAISFSVDFINKGVAPFYYNWPLEFSIADADGNIVSKHVSDKDIRSWLPGGVYTVDSSIGLPSELAKGTYKLQAAILDPATNKPSIQFAVSGKNPDGRYEIASFNVQ